MGITSKSIFKIIPFIAVGAVLLAILFIVKGGDKSAVLYETHCQSCHLEKGEGLRGIIPPLAQADYLEKYPEKLACIIRYGMNQPIIVNGIEYHENMPANPNLTDSEITNIINYVLKNFGNDLPTINFQTVSEQLENCEE
ncbi:c-type cytochrome [Flexithrix dorotheae]|uniref:c-type cytochrome n=1 Tax=Flexithrix dorotheae TaxID=70993 RepID=UPI00036151FD|nr:cytochrome c [Flexithrix dorotheae]